MNISTKKLNEHNAHVSELYRFFDDEDDIFDINWDFYRKLYSDDFLNEIVDRLEIYRNEDRIQMCFNIMIAADAYKDTIRFNEQKAKTSDYLSSLKKLRTGLKKITKELNLEKDISDIETHYQISFLSSAQKVAQEKLKTPSLYNHSALLNVFAEKKDFSVHDIFMFLEVLEEATNREIDEPSVKTPEFENPIENWIRELSMGWQSYSTIPFRTGKYYSKEIGYISKSMEIMCDLMKPLNDQVTNIQIGNALRAWKEKQVTNQE